jgi:hypothetical protein
MVMIVVARGAIDSEVRAASGQAKAGASGQSRAGTILPVGQGIEVVFNYLSYCGLVERDCDGLQQLEVNKTY